MFGPIISDLPEQQPAFTVEQTTVGSPIMTLKQTAAYLGLSLPTVRRLMASGTLKYSQLPTGTIRIHKDDIDQMLREHKR